MSQTDTYEVEEIGADTELSWMRCRRCDRVWNIFEAAFRGIVAMPRRATDDE